MKRLFTLFTGLCVMLLAGCNDEYDDSALVKRLDDFEQRLERLERLCNDMNTNLGSMQTIVTALDRGDYITSVEPLTENGSMVGYTIRFAKGTPIVVYNGKPGTAPVVSVKKDTDGIYYWTLDGEWLEDSRGDWVVAQGPAGRSAYELAVENGYRGTLEEWLASLSGNNGLSAYELAVEHGYSAVMMAPTQILAEQHYLKFRQMLDKLDVPVSLVTAERKEESHISFGGQGGIVVGTHALLYGKNVPERLGLVVIDEQHKFGVNQREKLIAREERPDVLVMTATPIPRTLTLTFYGDLDVSILDGMPGGRGKVVTAIRTAKDREKVVKFVRDQLEEGRQIYVVSPLIDGEESRKGKAVTKELDEWKALLPHVDVGLLHGRMPAEEKEAVMKDFRDNRTSVLVSTTVVEVGVDVPNATVMIINNAENFGLSQLHQLRGRIGRGAYKSYCILMTEAQPGDEQWEKLHIVETTSNGFDLAEQDLKLRGPGDVLGTSQSGLKGVRFEEWLLDVRLIHRGRELAEAILTEDPDLKSAKYRPLRFLLESGEMKRVAN